jgi:hypothetical protein
MRSNGVIHEFIYLCHTWWVDLHGTGVSGSDIEKMVGALRRTSIARAYPVATEADASLLSITPLFQRYLFATALM